MPLLSASLIEDLVRVHQSSHTDLTVMTTEMEDPTGYGRILRNHAGLLKRIVEEKDADASLRTIKEINSGLYCVQTKALFQALASLSNHNAQGEYYRTDIVELIANKGSAVAYKAPRSDCLLGVNDLYSLSIAEAYLRMRINKQYMLQGVSMINPETITIGEEVEIEEGVVLHPNTYITGHSIIRKDAIVGPNTEVHNSTLGERVHARHSLIYDSIVEADTVVGPFAHLRDRAHIGTHNRIGNFVEVKNSTTQNNTKASHLAYIGDCTMGENVNFGCGAITVNYDGVHKNRTTIGNNVFIGCNTNLIAPVQLEDDSYTAAGSTVTKLVPKGTLAIARANQVNKENYVEDYFKKRNGKKTEK
jgi:bifunctional UDP-N-acetylglucosamine pyrophosphorylase/glucosamine-1-phosphate N-acetyltransferase